MTAQTQSNGRVRKSLADQIDRLDNVIDALGDGLNEAVLTVVEQAVTVAVKEAVQAAVTEVLTNPELRARLAPTAPVAQVVPTPMPGNTPAPLQANQAEKPSLWQHLGGMIRAGWKWLSATTVRAWEVVSGCTRTCANAVAGGVESTRKQVQPLVCLGWEVLIFLCALACRFRTPLLVASGVGLGVALVCYQAGPVFASTVSGFAGFCFALLTSLARKVWRELEKLNSLLSS
jgi:hypothetical protein